jgi:hypothetical protein
MGIVLEPGLILAAAGIILANAATIATVFINLNVKIAENAKDILALKNDIEEHKLKNKDDIKDLKEIILRDKADNRDDHKAILLEVAALVKNLSDFKVEIIKAIQININNNVK